MPSYATALVAFAQLGLVCGQGVIISAQAQGDNSVSKGLQGESRRLPALCWTSWDRMFRRHEANSKCAVDPNDQNDANFISQSEIVANIVNECGRTFLGGNIDIGEQTEIALEAGDVTKVQNGTVVDVTVNQRSANGTGPFTCDMDLSSNANGAVGQTLLQVTQGNARDNTGDVTFQVAMPDDMACFGGE
jgi:hypothetical protein